MEIVHHGMKSRLYIFVVLLFVVLIMYRDCVRNNVLISLLSFCRDVSKDRYLSEIWSQICLLDLNLRNHILHRPTFLVTKTFHHNVLLANDKIPIFSISSFSNLPTPGYGRKPFGSSYFLTFIFNVV